MHIMMVWDGSGGSNGLLQLYINGSLQISKVFSGHTGPLDLGSGTTPQFIVGADPGNAGHGQYSGLIQRVRISNIARSSAYAKSVYKTGLIY